MSTARLALTAALLALALPPAVQAVSPEQAASECYDQVKRMGFSSRDMEDRSWEDCMASYRRASPASAQPTGVWPAPPAIPAPRGSTPEQQALLIQQWRLLNQRPVTNPGLEAGRGVLGSICNSQGGYYTPDGQCLRPMPPPPQLPARTPTWQCQQAGNTTNCSAY